MKRTRLGLWYGARLVVQLATACYLTISCACFNLRAEPQDFTALSLEELTNIRLRASSVMGIHHTHPKGEWMFGYTQMRMRMAGNRSGNSTLSDQDVLKRFMVAPTSMDMDMHMFGVMYAPIEDFTIMAMVPAMRLSMDHETRRGTRFTTQSSGLGDVSVTGLYTFWKQQESRIHVNFGGSFPTGTINARGDTPAGPGQRLPYPMQLGIGTFALKPGITYFAQSERWNWGGHTSASLPLGRNDHGYRIGNSYVLDGWLSRRWNDSISTSVRTVTSTWGSMHGADPALNPRMVPTADPDLRGGTRVDLRLGISFYVPDGDLARNRFAVELTLPTYQSLKGPQLQVDWGLNVGWQYAWSFGSSGESMGK